MLCKGMLTDLAQTDSSPHMSTGGKGSRRSRQRAVGSKIPNTLGRAFPKAYPNKIILWKITYFKDDTTELREGVREEIVENQQRVH